VFPIVLARGHRVVVRRLWLVVSRGWRLVKYDSPSPAIGNHLTSVTIRPRAGERCTHIAARRDLRTNGFARRELPDRPKLDNF